MIKILLAPGYECCMCSRAFDKLHSLDKHLITHDPKDYKCYVCDKRFNVLSGVMLHWEQSSCGTSAPRKFEEDRQLNCRFVDSYVEDFLQILLIGPSPRKSPVKAGGCMGQIYYQNGGFGFAKFGILK